MFGRLLARDLAIALLVVLAWFAFAPLSAGGGPAADLAGALLGAGAFAVGHIAHEWGHLIGAMATGARVAAPASLGSFFLFSFDARNSRRQFVIMSLAGFAVTVVALYVVYGLLPQEWLATRVARGFIVFAASLTLFLEVPLLVISLLRGATLAQVEVFPVPRN